MLNEFDGLHDWQQGCLQTWLATDGPFLVMACPGAGKTRLATRVIRIRKGSPGKQFAIVVCPTDPIKDQWANTAHYSDGLKMTTKLRAGTCAPLAFDGACVTYAQLPMLVRSIETWRRNGLKILVVFDEVHHCSEDATWGIAATSVGQSSDRILSLSGTPFRSDGSRIPFIEYSKDGFAIPQSCYTYAQAIADGVCRRVMFNLRDGFVQRKWKSDERSVEQLLTKCSDEETGSWLRSGLVCDGDIVKNLIQDAWSELKKMRDAGDLTAAMAIHCMPSSTSDYEAKYIEQVAKVVLSLTGIRPTVVHNGIANASELIPIFAASCDQIIIAVKMFSEGVDIPRCRVGVYLSNVTTETALRQMVGRHIRSERNKGTSQYAYVAMPDVPVFRDFATKVELEVKVGIKDAEDRLQKRQACSDIDLGERNSVQTLSVTAEGASVVLSGDVFNSGDESLGKAEAMSDEFKHIPTADIARIIRKASSESFSSCAVAEPPMHVQCKHLRAECCKLAKKIHFSSPSDFPEVSSVFASVNITQRIPYGVKNAHDWIEENLGVSGLQARKTMLLNLLRNYQ
jgi:superfamily II DNA or RNA helicase